MRVPRFRPWTTRRRTWCGERGRGPPTPISFSTPRGKFECKLLSDGRCVLEQRTPKGVTAYAVRPEHVRRVMRLDIGDSNNTTYLMVAIDPNHALVAGKQKMQTLLAQVRGKDAPATIQFLDANGPCPGRDVYEARLRDQPPGRDGAPNPDVHLRDGCARRVILRFVRREQALRGAQDGSGLRRRRRRGCVKANHKFNQGHLFMFDDGLAFAERPALWLPWEDVADLQLQRADGGSGTFDLRVTPEGGEGSPHEFANVSREELEEVQRYLAKRCSEAGGEDEPGNRMGRRARAGARRTCSTTSTRTRTATKRTRISTRRVSTTTTTTMTTTTTTNEEDDEEEEEEDDDDDDNE